MNFNESQTMHRERIDNAENENEYLGNTEDHSASILTFATENENTLRNNITLREWLLNLLHSTKYQILIVSLVAMDTLIVITELLIDLELKGRDSQVPHVLHSLSISFLCLFVIEIFVKIYAYKLEFFTLKSELFDALVVIVALILDVLSIHSHDALSGSGLIIVLRLWRIVRIQNSIVMSVRRSGEKKLASEREMRKVLETELEISREKNLKLRQFCSDLLKFLQDHQIKFSHKYSLTELELDKLL